MLGNKRGSSGATRMLRWYAIGLLIVGILAIPQVAGAQTSWPEGRPIKGASTSEIRWVENGASWHVPSMEVLRQCLGGDNRIMTVSDDDFRSLQSSYLNGGDIGCPNYPTGTLYKAPYNPTVWLVMNGLSYYVADDATVNCWGGWGTVHWVSSGEAVRLRNTYPQTGTAPCPPPDGSVLRGSAPDIWLVYQRRAWPVASMEMLNQCVWQGYWLPLRQVDNQLMDQVRSYPKGTSAACPRAPRTDSAVSWAQSQLGQSRLPDGWPTDGSCDHFAGLAYGMANSGYGSAYTHWQDLANRGLAHKADQAVPYGALAFFGPVSGNSDGHVMLSLGDGSFISTGTTVHRAKLSDFGNYLGWAWANPEWPGR